MKTHLKLASIRWYTLGYNVKCDCDSMSYRIGSNSDLMIAKHKSFVRWQLSLKVIDKFSLSLYGILTFNTLWVRYEIGGKKTQIVQRMRTF